MIILELQVHAKPAVIGGRKATCLIEKIRLLKAYKNEMPNEKGRHFYFDYIGLEEAAYILQFVSGINR